MIVMLSSPQATFRDSPGLGDLLRDEAREGRQHLLHHPHDLVAWAEEVRKARTPASRACAKGHRMILSDPRAVIGPGG